MLRAPKKPSETAYSTSMIMYGSSPIHISSCLRGIPTHELSVNLSRDPSSLRTTIVMRSVAVIGERTVPRLTSLEPQHGEHVVAPRRLADDPGGGAQRARGEDVARRRAVPDLDPLGRPEEVRGVLADDIAAAHRGHADLAARAGADIAVACVALDPVVVGSVTGGDLARDRQRGARRRIALRPVVRLDDLGVPLRAEH